MDRSRKSTRFALSTWLRVAFAGAVCTLAVGIASFAQTDESAQFQVFSLKWQSAADIKKMLEKLLDGGTQIISDPQRNQILIRGSAKDREIARQLIRNTDRLPKVTRDSDKPLVKTYRCPKARLKSTADKLRSLYSGDSGVRIAVDSATSRLLVLALPRLQEAIAGQLARINNADAQTVSPLPEVSRRETQQRQIVRLENADVESVRRSLRLLLRNRLKERDGQHQSEFVVEVAGKRVTLTGDSDRKTFTIVGPASLTRQLMRLIERLDSPPQTDGRKVRIVPIRNVDPDAIKRIVEAYRGSNRNEESRESPRSNKASPDVRPPDDSRPRQPNSNRRQRQSSVAPSGSIEPVSFQTSQPAGEVQNPPSPARNGAAQPSDDDESLRDRIERLGNDVEIESLPDLDIIILRGRNQAVGEITRIIREIERLSEETAPAIDIYYLRHVRDEAVAELVDRVNEDLTGGLQGRVSITPLARPNALLLIGWGEAVKAVRQLIQALDQPARPGTLVRVFQLKHAAADSARTTIEQFFDDRPGLGPKVKVSADNRTNALIVEASPRDMDEVKLLIDRLDVAKGRAVNQARIFKLNNSLANDLAAILQTTIDSARGGQSGAGKSAILEMLTIDPQGKRIVESGLLADVRITPDPRTNSVIVSAPAESMELLATLIRSLDESPASVAQIKVFRIINSDARSLVQVLTSLLPSQSGTSPVPRLASAKGETSLVPMRFAVDARTNSIIATGSAGDLKIVEALLLRLDEEGGQNRKSAVIRLKNAPATDVAFAINEFLRTERQVQESVTGTENPFRQIESEVVVVPEPIGNSLIISATPRFFDEITALIETLDAEPAQVMIQVIIAEVVLGDTDEFGVELGLQDSLLFDRSLLGDLITTTTTSQQSTANGIVTATQETIQAASNTPGFSFNNQPLGNSGSSQALATANAVAGQALSSFATGRINTELGYGGLVLSAGSENISVLIRALQASRRMEILSRPQIMTLDNQPAFIQVGQRVPRIIGSTVNQTGQVNNIALENVGLILGVTPRISPDGMVVMEIDAEKSDLGPEADGIPVSVSATGNVVRSPRVNITTAQTTVSAADGETIVLGGLITKSNVSISRRVPFLSEIPVVKSLFKFESHTTRRTELLIILTPHIIRSPKDRERMKQVEMARMHWVASDVYELHGATGACKFGDCPIDDSTVPMIYPDLNPRGLLPEETGSFERQLSHTGAEVEIRSLEETPLPIPIPDPRLLDQQTQPVDIFSEQRPDSDFEDQNPNKKAGGRRRMFFWK